MFERLRRGFGSGERKGGTVTDMGERILDHRIDDLVRPGLKPRLQRALHEQNEDDQMAYIDALIKQRDELPTRADGSPLRLGLVDPETGHIVQPPGETADAAETGDEGPPPPYTPPSPPSVA